MDGLVRRLPALLTALAVLLCCMLVLCADGGVGLADNGDFRRVLAGNGLEVADKTDANYLFKREYTMQLAGENLPGQVASLVKTYDNDTAYWSPHFWFVKASKLVNFAINLAMGRDPGHYDVFYLALLYALCLALAAYMVMRFFAGRNPAVQLLAACLLLTVFCDAGYLVYFNSFYGEPLQYVALMLAVGAALTLWRKRGNVPALVLYLAALYLFAGAKLANIPIAAVFLAFGVLLFFREPGCGRRATCVSLSTVCLAAMLALFGGIPSWMNRDTNYQAVFYGVLRGSDTPEQDLMDLGIDPQYAVLQNTNAYLAQYPGGIDIHGEEFDAAFHQQIGKVDLAVFYLTHPGRMLEKMDISLENSGAIRPIYLGNSPTERMTLTTRWSAWSDARQWLFTHDHARSMEILLCFAALVSAIWVFRVLFRFRRHEKWKVMAATALLALLCGMAASLLLPFMSNGEADLAKHMFLFVSFTDLLWAGLVLAAAMRLSRRNIRIYAVGAAVIAGFVAFSCVVDFSPRPKVVQFGAWNGKPLQWEVVRQLPDGERLLVCKEPVARMAFDTSNQYGENRWIDSDLRAWLNDGFMDAFSENERARMLPAKTDALLSNPFAADAAHGTHVVYWSALPCVQDWENAYCEPAEDLVTLPGLVQLTDTDWSSNGCYWLADPYGGNDTMVRLADNGYAIFADACTEQAVRPMIMIK